MIEPALLERANSVCEICGSTTELTNIKATEGLSSELDNSVLVCAKCNSQISHSEPLDNNHLRCLNESMWSQEPAVQIIAYRLLTKLAVNETWARDALEMLYIEDSILALAKDSLEAEDDQSDAIVHRDSNGNILQAGDSVTLIKDLNVKGANFTAKRGTSVRRITLVPDNSDHIEGRVNDQRIVILTKFVKKTN